MTTAELATRVRRALQTLQSTPLERRGGAYLRTVELLDELLLEVELMEACAEGIVVELDEQGQALPPPPLLRESG